MAGRDIIQQYYSRHRLLVQLIRCIKEACIESGSSQERVGSSPST